MKKKLFILSCMLFLSFGIFAQSKTIVKMPVMQADALNIDVSGDPVAVGDISKFEINGGAAPYSDFQWEASDAVEGKNHEVKVEDANKCTVTIYVNVLNFNSIEEIDVDAESVAFPNPATDIINIPVSTADKKVILMLINADGLVLYKNSVEVTGETYPLSLSICPSGKYFIQVTGSQIKTYSIIKK